MNGICEIVVGDVKHSLMFRMKAVQIFKDKVLIATTLLNKDIEDTKEWKAIDEIRLLSYMIFAGKCNYSESLDLPYPNYSDCYDLVDLLLDQKDGNAQIEVINKTFNDSSATKKLIDLINSNKEVEATPNVKKKIVKKTTG